MYQLSLSVTALLLGSVGVNGCNYFVQPEFLFTVIGWLPGPYPESECNDLSFGSLSESFMFECDSTSIGTLYYYYGSGCSGDPYNSTTVVSPLIACDGDVSDCDTYEIGFEVYNDTSDCDTDDPIVDSVLYQDGDGDDCIYATILGFGPFYAMLEIDSDSWMYTYYQDDECTIGANATFTIYATDCNGNYTFTIEEDSDSSDSGDSGDSDSSETTTGAPGTPGTTDSGGSDGSSSDANKPFVFIAILTGLFISIFA